VKKTKKLFHITGDPLGWGWIRTDKFMKRVTRIPMWSDEAAYAGLIDVLKYVAHGSHLLIKIDSRLVHDQFYGKRVYKEPRLRELRNEVRKLIRQRELEVEVEWVNSYDHLAARLLRSRVRRTWWA